ncbi:MAG: response regulator [Chitinophagaceae bacterium]
MKLTTMIVDDDTLVTFLHKTLIVKCGLVTQPIIAFDGQQALEYIRNFSDPEMSFLIFLDINMPVMNGWELLDQLQNLKDPRRFYAIMVTSSIYKIDRENAKKYPQVIGFFEKPLNFQSCQEIKNIPEINHLLLKEE